MSITSSSASAADGMAPEALPVQVPTSPPMPASQATMDHIRQLSQRLFPGPISTRVGCDPENPGESWIVFDVEAKGTYANFRDREFQWYEAVAKMSDGEPIDFRLCILPKP